MAVDFDELRAQYDAWKAARNLDAPTAAAIDQAIQAAWQLVDDLQQMAAEVELQIEALTDRHYDLIYSSGPAPADADATGQGDRHRC